MNEKTPTKLNPKNHYTCRVVLVNKKPLGQLLPSMKVKIIDLKKYLIVLFILWMLTLFGCFYFFKFIIGELVFLPVVIVISIISLAFKFIAPYLSFYPTQLEIRDGYLKFSDDEIDVSKINKVKRDFLSLGYVKVKIGTLDNKVIELNFTYNSSKKLGEYLKQNAILLK